MKMIKIDYYNTRWSDSLNTPRLDITSQKKTLLINMDLIASVSPDSVRAISESSKPIKLHYLNTQIAYGRGINGVDYNSYYVTEETYKRIIKNIELC